MAVQPRKEWILIKKNYFFRREYIGWRIHVCCYSMYMKISPLFLMLPSLKSLLPFEMMLGLIMFHLLVLSVIIRFQIVKKTWKSALCCIWQTLSKFNFYSIIYCFTCADLSCIGKSFWTLVYFWTLNLSARIKSKQFKLKFHVLPKNFLVWSYIPA